MSELIVTLIQSDLHWEDPDANLQMFEKKINGLREKTEIIILPEMFSTGFSMQSGKLAESMEGKTIQWMKHISAKKNVILTGSLILEEEEHCYNRLLWMLPNGDTGHYDKRHLFAFAGEDAHYERGNKKLIARVKGWKICPIVCYDLRFPVWIRQSPNEQKHYDVLICVANWPDSRIQAWSTLLQARAIENQCYVIGVNRTGKDGNGIAYSGHSMIIDPLGKILIDAGQEEAVVTYQLTKEKLEQTRTQFPFLKDADPFRL